MLDLETDFIPLIRRRQEVETGYRFFLARNQENLRRLADFVWFESGCCQAFDFRIEVCAGETDLVLRITGPEGTRQFLDRVLPSPASAED